MDNVFKKIGFIGYGKFTKLLIELFRQHLPEAELLVSSRTASIDNKLFFDRKDVCQADLIIPCVPIRYFEETITNIVPLLRAGQTILDVCSVKVFPKQTLIKLVPNGINLIGSHPMFGPASYAKLNKKLTGCCAILENIRSEQAPYAAVKDFFNSLELNIVEMSAEEHDKKAAQFQFITLTTATVLKKLNIHRESIDTPSALKMLDFLDMISVDGDLVADLYNYNPYCHDELSRLEGAFNNLCTELHSGQKKISKEN